MDSGQLSQQARLLITGHSLGGALAVLAAFDIKRAMGSFRVELYTYGTPYPGNRAFARQFNALLPDTWHVIHDGVRSLASKRICHNAGLKRHNLQTLHDLCHTGTRVWSSFCICVEAALCRSQLPCLLCGAVPACGPCSLPQQLVLRSCALAGSTRSQHGPERVPACRML